MQFKSPKSKKFKQNRNHLKELIVFPNQSPQNNQRSYSIQQSQSVKTNLRTNSYNRCRIQIDQQIQFSLAQHKQKNKDSTISLSSSFNQTNSKLLKYNHSTNFQFNNSNQITNNINSYDLKLGKQLFKQNRIEQALIIFEKYLLYYGIHPEALYLSALCYQQQNQYDKLIQQLEQLISIFPTFQRNAYLILSNVFVQMNRIQDSINNLTLAINNFNKFYDALLLRAQLYLKCKFTHKAIQDFNQLILINPKQLNAYLGLSDCFKQMNQIQQAFQYLNIALQIEQISNSKPIIIKLFYLFFDISDFKQSIYYLNILKQIYPEDSESSYLQGLWFQKQSTIIHPILDLTQEVQLAFEQTLKYNNNKLYTTQALLEIIKFEIDNNNFYSASHHLQRKVYLDVFSDQLQYMENFVEGTLSLMKKQYDKGIEYLSQMIYQQNDKLHVLALQFRAYGYFYLSNYHQALKDLQECDQKLLEKASVYNLLLCQALITFEENDLNSSHQLFQQAKELLQTKLEPYFYQATLLIRKYCININEQNRIIYLNQALECLQKAILIRESSSVLFYKGILNFALGNLDIAYQDLELAIENSNEDKALYFYVRGLLHNCLKIYDKAILDFKCCLHLESDHLDSYINRCISNIHIGDLDNAHIDLMKYIENCKVDELNYQMIGMLFFHIGSLEEAIFSLNMDQNINSQLLKIKILMFCKELNLAHSELQLISQDNNKAYVDFKLISILKQMCADEIYTNLQDNISVLSTISMNRQEGEIFKLSHIWFYYGVLLTFQKEYTLALEYLNSSYELERKLENFQSQDFGNQIYIFKEYLYNNALLNLMMKNCIVAIELLNNLYENLDNMEEKVQLQLFIKLVQDDMLDTEKNIRLIGENEFYLFQQENRFSQQLPILHIPFKKYNVKSQLSFGLPKIKFPSIDIGFDERLLHKITPQVVENYPEAPWIKRVKQQIVFTDDLRLMDQELESTMRDGESEEELRSINQVSKKFDDE